MAYLDVNLACNKKKNKKWNIKKKQLLLTSVKIHAVLTSKKQFFLNKTHRILVCMFFERFVVLIWLVIFCSYVCWLICCCFLFHSWDGEEGERHFVYSKQAQSIT